MIDKDFCLSSYIALRYIWKEDVDFAEGQKHELFRPMPTEQRVSVASATDMDEVIRRQFNDLYKKYENIGILLSGGMDSAILAAYLREGSHAYTFTAKGTNCFDDDVARAASYCKKFGLVHHLIEIGAEDYNKFTPDVIKRKCAPVHSIEPQIYKASLAAKADGVDLVIVGESADLIFGGMDQLLSKDWTYDEFVRRYTFLDPEMVLTNPVSMSELFEKYRNGNGIRLLDFMDNVFSIESSSSYLNAFATAQMPYYDPYACMIMRDELDMARVRNGEPKYLVRELYSLKYPEFPVPAKIPMPRPVDLVFKNWEGPKRSEFRNDIPMDKLTGNQKWQLWCAELFLNTLPQ
ncbi:MAG: hypothetical protein IJY78_06800 [Bacteroidaceae bacterium]|nr:hypothetical protein [Bacteroidaceae bacterium]